MKKIIFALALTLFTSLSFAQGKKEPIKKTSTDTSHVIESDTTEGSYYSMEQGKFVGYKVLINKDEIKHLTNCYGYLFRDKEGNTIAYTPCKDYSFKSLVVIDKDKFIEFLRTNQLSLK